MKLISGLFLVWILLLSGCTPKARPTIDWKPDLSLSLQDAEQMLGESTHIKNSSAYLEGNTKTYESSYFANAVDTVTGKTGTLYFMYEEYENVESASLSYESIRKANERAPGVQPLIGVGDEAYFHSDGTNFLFVLSRSENKMFRIKVNKTTSHTNEVAFIAIASAFWK
jgi:hypothetical protein